MPDKNLTDAEIVKALRRRMYKENKYMFSLLQNALDLINRIQAENERLNKLAELGNMRANDYRVMRDRALKAEKEVERLKNAYKQCAWEQDCFEDDNKRLYEIIENKNGGN